MACANKCCQQKYLNIGGSNLSVISYKSLMSLPNFSPYRFVTNPYLYWLQH